jgi:PAS domain S-box-containing protein
MSNEDEMLRMAALKNAQSIFFARQRAERELSEAREALERKTEELAQQREWFRVTLSSIGDGVIVTGQDGKVNFVNPMAEKLTGWNAEEAMGRPFKEVAPIIDEETGEPVEDPVEAVLQKGVIVDLAGNTVLRARDGRSIPIEDSAAPILGENGEMRGVVLVFHDVTEKHAGQRELREAKERAEAASRSKDDFLAALSHELRTPLTPVLMTAAALHEDERLPADVRDQLGMMERNISIEARLIDDLLDLTRISRGKLPLQLQACDTHSLISLATEIVRNEAQVKGIAIERKFEAVRSGLMADPARFQQVMWNLLRNAVKYTPDGGRVTIRTADAAGREGGHGLRIEVSDTGIGIEQEYLERIFQAFDQGGISGEHRFGGLGLGLSIVRAIVDLHGGAIHAESEGKGHGAVFIIELPEAVEPARGLIDSPQNAREPGGPTTAGEGGLTLRLLIVEDHRATLDVLQRLLVREGHYVVGTGTVAAALEAAAQTNFDAVISDLGLPDGTGTELMMKLRERHGLRGIALSGYGMEEDTERTREAGFIAHLIKPVDFNQLRRTLERLATLPEGH